MKFSEKNKDIIEKIVPTLSPQAANAFGAFLQWADDNKFVEEITKELEGISDTKRIHCKFCGRFVDAVRCWDCRYAG